MESVRLDCSQDLSITRKEAQEYIEQYFKTYPGIKRFLDQAVADAKEKGYVTTMFGRRRPVPELKSFEFHAAIIRGARGDECADSGYCS